MLEVIALCVVVAVFIGFGFYGLLAMLILLIAWQIHYRIKQGHWMQGINH